MQRWFVFFGLAAVALPAARSAEEKFSRAVRAEDFSAAGLLKLSAAELARLDALVRDFKTGALDAARREAAAAQQARVEAESRASKAESDARTRAAVDAAARQEGPGLLARARVLLAPGTEVEYSTVETRITAPATRAANY